jgi:very-short-patch-repair endonuclease
MTWPSVRSKMKRWKFDTARDMRKHQTLAEHTLWIQLRKKHLGARWHRQAPLFGYIADFWCPSLRIIVEVDGPIHRLRKETDKFRDSVFENHGIKTIRFSNYRVLHNLGAVVNEITEVVALRSQILL